MITELGEMTLGALQPQLTAVLAVEISSLEAQLAGALQAQVGLVLTPPTLIGQVAAIAELAAAVAAAIILGVPDVSFQLAAVVDLIAVLEAQLALLAEFTAALAVGGVSVYSFDGLTGAFGSELDVTLGDGFAGGDADTPANALILATTSGATWEAIEFLFGL